MKELFVCKLLQKCVHNRVYASIHMYQWAPKALIE